MILTLFSCKHTLAKLDDYLDRELSAREMWAVEWHLKTCHACEDKFEFEREFVFALRERLPVVTALEELWSDVSGAVRAEAGFTAKIQTAKVHAVNVQTANVHAD